MRTIANFLWHIPFLGFLNAFLCYCIGTLFIITIVFSPIGLGLIQYGKFLMAPYSRKIVSTSTITNQNIAWQGFGCINSLIYLPFGIILAIITIVQIVGLLCSIVGIPLAYVLIKSLSVIFNPVGKSCITQ